MNVESLAKQIETRWLALDDDPTPLYLREWLGEWELTVEPRDGSRLVRFFDRQISLVALRERVFRTLSEMRPG